MDAESIELAARNETTASETGASTPRYSETNDASNQNLISLEPVDGGFSAWSFLVAAFLIEVLVWGFPNTSGVLLAAYLDDPVYASQKDANSLLPLIGTLCLGIMYCSGIIIYPIMYYYPQIRRYLTWFGTLLCTGSLLGASFSTKLTTLVVLQGGFFAVGGSIAYAPVVSYLTEWFVQRRGLANGIIFCGASTGGIVFPIVFPILIERFGISRTVRGYAITLFVGMLPALLFMKARLPESRVHGPRPRARTENTWLKNKNFWFFMVINAAHGLGLFVPLTWLPTYASALGLSSAQGSLSLTLFNVFGAFSSSIIGFLSDKYDVWVLALSSLVLTSLATFLLWGLLSYSLAGILVYSIVYGAATGGFGSLWSAFAKPIAKDDTLLTTTIFASMMLGRGIGNIISTPVSTALQKVPHTVQSSGFKSGFTVAGGKYEDMIIFAGSCFAGGALITLVGWSLDRRSRRD